MAGMAWSKLKRDHARDAGFSLAQLLSVLWGGHDLDIALGERSALARIQLIRHRFGESVAL